MTLGERAEETVDEIKPNSEIGVGEAFVVHAVMMNVVESARVQKPSLQERHSGHPKVLKMHPVVNISIGQPSNVQSARA